MTVCATLGSKWCVDQKVAKFIFDVSALKSQELNQGHIWSRRPFTVQDAAAYWINLVIVHSYVQEFPLHILKSPGEVTIL